MKKIIESSGANEYFIRYDTGKKTEVIEGVVVNGGSGKEAVITLEGEVENFRLLEISKL